MRDLGRIWVEGRLHLHRRIARAGGWGNRTFTALPETVTEREEFWNSLTGGLGLLGSLIALALIIDTPTPNLLVQLSAVIYGLTLVASYGATTIYHSARCHVRKARWRILDHCAVFVLIAGSYTPLAIAGLGGRFGWLVLSAIWVLAALGIAFKLRFRFRFPGTSVAIYLVMGWLGVFLVGGVLSAVGPGAVSLLVAGGLCYTLGTVFFGAKRLPYHHAVWHLLVILGSVFHYMAIVDHVLAAAV